MAAFVAGKDDRVEEVPKETNCSKDIFQLEMTILNKESATQMHTALDCKRLVSEYTQNHGETGKARGIIRID